jgi:hypothetical protein
MGPYPFGIGIEDRFPRDIAPCEELSERLFFLGHHGYG